MLPLQDSPWILILILSGSITTKISLAKNEGHIPYQITIIFGGIALVLEIPGAIARGMELIPSFPG